ncbi:YfjI family protein [Stenotrophomonas maltophilia]|uniref:YfjI family protein n=1 Tax=Stenotrophomonas maltophilia TaxID=40324 RepID=UPI000C14E244|nr:YfjI family protein [Stenotrophomonas maltophilia]MBH1379489.1 DUF3987 domain-containing protein [Stenotrophomonas maltophilia]MBH1395894.1 DUF3987 domain-containing protein [Stenotrophomonas maltophilia]MBH1472018.1 DUF3987 domain-containing protein [Stenotrophomonas maltophilia]MDZ5787071.1 YfjI family protein [Stenotrophomonas maltophilia]HDS1096369.1 DUF3987 domain-containing protein [Stenotrophomonas maltophilia]
MTYSRLSHAYPTHAMYSDVRQAILEVQGNLQAPDALIAGSFLTAMSIACQGDVDVELPTGQVRPVSLSILTVADSGERKTATDSIVCAPIYDHDARMAQEHASAMLGYHADLRLWVAKDSSIQRKIGKALTDCEEASEQQLRQELISHEACKPTRPAKARIVHQNITERPLIEAMQGDGKSIAILSDEGEIVLKGGAMRTFGTLNKAWDGPKTLQLDRVDDNIEVRNPRLTISMMVQEKVFSAFMDKRGHAARGSGHLARYLVAYPPSTQGFRFTSLDQPVWEHLPRFHSRVSELLEANHARRASGDHTRRALSFTAEAKELWVQTQNTMEPRLRDGGDLVSVRDFASKSMEIAGRVAAILHHFSAQEGVLITMETLHRALDIVGWHFQEFVRLFGDSNDEPEQHRDVRALAMYLWRRYWTAGYTAAVRNEVRKCGPIRDQRRFELALHQLWMEGSVQVMHENAVRGKGRLWIHLNPTVFSQVTAG